jgi:hypothetical protein
MVSLASFMPMISTSAPVAAELQHRHVERGDRRDVPDVGAADVDRDLLQHLLEVEGGMKSSAEAKNTCPSTT